MPAGWSAHEAGTTFYGAPVGTVASISRVKQAQSEQNALDSSSTTRLLLAI